MQNESLLGNALASTETAVDATPDPAQVEQTESATDQSATTDSSLQATDESVEQPKTDESPTEEKVETRAELDFKALRGQKDTLETELSQVRENLNKYGGESHLSIMQPVLAKAQELPSTPQELESWSPEMWTALSQTLVPEQVKALKSEAAWTFLNEPASQRVIAEDLFGEGATPDLLRDLVEAYKVDPTILDVLRPEETEQQRLVRVADETRNRERDAQMKAIQEQNDKRENEFQQMQTKQVMSNVFQVALAPRAEVKKQHGLEFQKSDKDTPEIAAFKERASRRYDLLTTLQLSSDSEMNRLSNSAQYLAGQKDDAQRKRAHDQFSPLLEARTRAVCTQVAKDLAEDLKLFSPELSDRAKADNLKDLPAQVLGSTAGSSTASGMDFSDMPDSAADPRAYEAWVARITAARHSQQRGPAILQAG